MLVLDDRDLIRWCGDQGIGVLSYGPLAYGLLTGAITPQTTFSRSDHRSHLPGLFGPESRERSLATVEAMGPIAGRLGITIAQLSLAWNVHQPGVTSAIAGSRDPAHARANADAGDVALDPQTLAELDAIVSEGSAAI
jgi:aryl-alcohol dehydrogenase-like predicted oxidoreductase